MYRALCLPSCKINRQDPCLAEASTLEQMMAAQTRKQTFTMQNRDVMAASGAEINQL